MQPPECVISEPSVRTSVDEERMAMLPCKFNAPELMDRLVVIVISLVMFIDCVGGMATDKVETKAWFAPLVEV